MLFSLFFAQKLSDITQMSPYFWWFLRNFSDELSIRPQRRFIMDPVQDFKFPQFDPKYLDPKGYRTSSIADDLTFCHHILAACQQKGLTPQSIDTKSFVNKCRNNLPEMTLTGVAVNGSSGQYFWSYLNGAGNWRSATPQSRNVFTTYRVSGAPSPSGGTVIIQAAKDVATPERCNDFGDGDSGMKPQTAPARAPAAKMGFTRASAARVVDQIELGVSVILGGIILYLTKGALPPLRAPVAPSLTPTIGSEHRRYPEA
jgi:hypothetical protein